jgi:prolipoprotein diacylglyceryltransferase
MERTPHTVLNRHLDNIVRLRIRLGHKVWLAYRAYLLTGVALGIIGAVMLAVPTRRSPWVAGSVSVMAALACLALAMGTKVLTGHEAYTLYHYQILVIGVSALLLRLLGQPTLRYLDLIVLALGITQVCGRIGCLMVGCCHGRPYRWGACYREEHAAAGFPRYLVEVRLFPIQAVESLWVFCIVLVGSTLVLTGHSPGETLAWYVVTYGLGRFCFEFVRGDPDRPYLWGFSEAQWTSLLLMGVVVGLELSGLLPFQPWHIGATVFLALIMIAIALKRRFGRTARHQLLHPRHVKEVAEVVESVSSLAAERTAIPQPNSDSTGIHVGCTSLGIQISASKIKSRAGHIHHYALSHQHDTMTEETAKTLADLIFQLRHLRGSSELVKGGSGVFHLLVHP